MWIIPSELTDALKGIGNALGGDGQVSRGVPEEEDVWVDTGEPMPTAFEDTILEDPARALAEARDEAARSSAEAEGHSAGVSARGVPRAPRPSADDGRAPATPLADPMGALADPMGPLADPADPADAAHPAVPPTAPTGLPQEAPLHDDPDGGARP
jgi:hypothetical protein